MSSPRAGGGLSLERSQYPDPFLDVASTRLPKSRKKLLELCFLFATTHPQISPIVKKLAKYPITRVIVNTKTGQDSLQKKWEDALEWDLNIYEVAEGVGLDFFGYGNSFVTIHRPFRRFYVCNSCKASNPAGSFKYYIQKKKIQGTCPKCKHQGIFTAKDDPVKIIDEVSIVRLQPQSMHVDRNSLTGQIWHYYNVPHKLKNAITGKSPNRDMIDTTPWTYVDAAIQGKKIKFRPGKVLHIMEPSLSGRDMAWGNPIILASLKDAYLNQIYKKADESLANERVIPARFVFPQASSQDPLRTISLGKFSSFLSKSLRGWRRDKNAIMPSPFPVGVAEVGGDAQRFATASLRQLAVKEIIGSTGVPEGFLADGMTWSGGSVQLRMLENMLMSYLRGLNRLLRFVIQEVSGIMGWPEVEATLKPFRMADDIQMLQILMQLADRKAVGYKEILDRIDLDFRDQNDQVVRETKLVQDIHIQEQLLQARAALRAADIQVESQMVGEGYQGVIGAMDQDDEAAMSHFKREGTYKELGQKMEQQQAQQQQAESQKQEKAQEAETDLQDARAQKYRAEAEQKGVHADMAASRVEKKVPQVIQSYVDHLLPMSEEERAPIMSELRGKHPKLAAKVDERLQEVEQRESAQLGTERKDVKKQQEAQASEQEPQQEEAQEPQQEEPQTPKDIDAALRAESKNIKEYADRLSMLPKEQRMPVFEYVRKTDPSFFVKVLKNMDMGVGANSGGGAKSVDMSPKSKTRPPKG